MNYGKILKWSTVGFLVAGLILSIYGFVNGWPTTEDISTVANAEQSVGFAQGAIDDSKAYLEEANKALGEAVASAAAAIDVAEEAAAAVKVATPKEKKSKEKALAKAEEQAYKLIEAEYAAQKHAKACEVTLTAAEKELKDVKATIEAAESRIMSVQLLLWGGYIFAAITLLAVIFGVVIIGGFNSPKSLLKLGVGVVAIVVIVVLAIILSPDVKESVKDLPLALKDQLLLNGGQEALNGSLRLTDAMLNLTYLLGGGALIALVAGWIIGLTRK